MEATEIKPDRLLEFAKTDRQKDAVRLWIKHDMNCKAARKEMGIKSESAFRNLLSRVKQQAAILGYAPEYDMTKVVPEPFRVKGISTLYDCRTGEPTQQWVKTSTNHEAYLAMLREVADELKQDIPALPPIKEDKSLRKSDDLLNLFVLTDAHIGALAWHEDGGDNWDLKIAEETINRAFDHLILSSQPASTAFFCQLGDGLHTDGLLPVTPAHHNVLDADGRYPKVVRTAVRIFRRNVDRLLATHSRVVALLSQGNHDESGSVWLQEMFSALYENNPRVEVIVSPLPYYAYKHGRVMLGFHHGHKAKVDKMPEVFMGEFRKMYGETDATFLHCGHLHHKLIKEFNSAIVEQHSTLAARDAYAAHGGYRGNRSMQCITYHRTKLEVGRTVFRP